MADEKDKGLRYNAGKPRMSLRSPWADEGLAHVLTYGASKYALWNWAKGLSWGETLDSLERHLSAFKKGEELDEESGLPHIDHVAFNVMALSHFQKLGTGTDDRWVKNKPQETVKMKVVKKVRKEVDISPIEEKCHHPGWVGGAHSVWCKCAACDQ